MRFKLITAPAVEPVTKAELKQHIRLTSGSLADNMTTEQSIVPGSHVVAAAYSLEGSSINVLGYDILVVFNSGTNEATGTVDVKLQDSVDETTWTDVASGAFTQVTTANDNDVYEKAYTGEKEFLRVVSTVANASCAFDVSVVKYAIYSTEDDLLDTYIISAREHVELLCGPLVTQTWEGYLEAWPLTDRIVIPKPRLQSVTSVEYTDIDEDESTYASSNYLVDIISIYGQIVLKKDSSYPTDELIEVNPIKFTFVCGYGDAASDVPQNLKLVVKLLAAHWFENREPINIGNIVNKIPAMYEALLANYIDYGGGY